MEFKKDDNKYKKISIEYSKELSKDEKVIKKRDDIWDNFKGILSFTVVFAHYLYHYLSVKRGTMVSIVFIFIYIFHMPAFIFCFGYFSKSENSKSRESLFKLVIHYFIFNTGMMIFMYFYRGRNFQFLMPYYSFWYLLSLIYWRIIIIYVDIENKKSIIIKTIALALINGYSKDFSNNIFSIRRTIAFFPFFLIGYLFPKDKFQIILNQLNSHFKKLQVCIIFIIYSLGVFFCVKKKIIYFSIDDLLMAKYKNFSSIKKRILIFIIAFFMSILLLLSLPNRKLPFLTMTGKNSLYIYLFHRVFPIFFRKIHGPNFPVKKIFFYGFIETIIIMAVFGNDFFTRKFSQLINYIYFNLSKNTKEGKKIRLFCLGIVFFLILFNPVKNQIKGIFSNINKIKNIKNKIVKIQSPKMNNNIQKIKIQTKKNINPQPKIKLNYFTTHILTKEMKKKLNSSIRISYVGDLILLKQQVISAFDEKKNKYDFNEMFKYTKEHFHKSDLSIGVFEGPTAGGQKKDYSTSNYGDGIPLYLNFPDEFVEAVKNSGINFVTTANNHLLDKGIKGAMRTLDILDKYNISHIGSYRNIEEKKNKELQIINVNGVKIAFLAYTKYVNYHLVNKLYENYNYLTSFIPNEKNKKYKELLQKIKNDVQKAKDSKADLIAVLLHMGTQFLHKPDNFQQKWNKIFTELGVDIILGDHPHAVQPIEFVNNNKTIIVNCPGNFANSYINKDGDATAIIDLYIDKESKKLIGSSVIPMYTYQLRKGFFIALPIYNVIKKIKFNDTINESDMKRIKEVQELSTNVIIGKKVPLHNVQEEYVFINNTFYSESNFIQIVMKYKDKELFKLINNSKNITFIGDSITEGTKNNFHPWFEPLINSFDNKKIINISKGSYTTKKIISDFQNHILLSNTQLYIIAIGTNDIRYRNKAICAMDKKEYIIEIDKIINLIKKSNLNSKIVLIAPWMSLPNDNNSKVHGKEKKTLFDEYSLSLKEYCKKNNFYILIQIHI